MKGKTITVKLTDDFYRANLSNWNGKTFKIPRNKFQCHIEEINNVGIYFLFSDDVSDSDSVFIGASENLQKEIHKNIIAYKLGKERFHWDEALIFTGADLNKELILYLEKRVIEIAKDCNRYKILSHNKTNDKNIEKSQIEIIEEFIDNMIKVNKMLNYKILEPILEKQDDIDYFYCKNYRGANATATVSGDKMIVHKGSIIANDTAKSFNKNKMYQSLIDDGTIVDGVFAKDCEFPSYTAASNVVLGVSTNGTKYWKTIDGTELKEYLESLNMFDKVS